MSEEIERHVVRKFEIAQRLGKGVRLILQITCDFEILLYECFIFSKAYGIVWKAVEKRSRVVVALKKCFDAFRNATDAQRTFREIMYLQVNKLSRRLFLEIDSLTLIPWDFLKALSGHENIIRLQHVIKAENDRDIYLTFDHMETGMHLFIN